MASSDVVATTPVVERIELAGVVQGVGFRPFVHRLATALGLDGYVGNDSTRVFIEVAGPVATLDRFVERLRSEAPPLARIEHVRRSPSLQFPQPGFRIVDSEEVDGSRTLVASDAATCGDCRRELFDASDRRFAHPFITCTNCGPRFTIIESVPYDRANTTMAGFAMCPSCEAEYSDYGDRRYHAQPLGCHECGPVLTYRSHSSDTAARGGDAIDQASRALASGGIVAVKGLGGHQLCCSATDDDAVARLRSVKHRPDKPFAVMVADVGQAETFAHLSDSEASLLQSSAAPIVLLRARSDSPLSRVVAPGSPTVGLMLVNTPVHHLLLHRTGVSLVITSANHPGEPIATSHDVIDQLPDLYDGLLDHDRPIVTPCDDSVVRVIGARLLPIRRARGYAPIPVSIPKGHHDVLAVGGEFKNTFCVTSGEHAWVSQHIGDMENLETVRVFESTVEQFLDTYDVEPERVVVDSHPGYLSSRWARTRYPARVVEVQHHHAHVASVMAEHRLDPGERVLGFAFDGTGYGDDGTIWGGELLVANAHRYERVAHLMPISLPGGDSAIAHPCRVALAHAYAAGIDWSDDLAPLRQIDPIERGVSRRQLDGGFGCVQTTSMGRLFDAVAALLGVRHQISFEAQAAIELEMAAETGRESGSGYRFHLTPGGVIQVAEVLRSVVADRAAGQKMATIAWRFHDAVAEIVCRLAVENRRRLGIETVVLSGGVFQNALLTELCLERLDGESLPTLTHSLVPPNDGGLALGQAYIAGHRNIVSEEV